MEPRYGNKFDGIEDRWNWDGSPSETSGWSVTIKIADCLQ
jgi:hypothetical protein